MKEWFFAFPQGGNKHVDSTDQSLHRKPALQSVACDWCVGGCLYVIPTDPAASDCEANPFYNENTRDALGVMISRNLSLFIGEYLIH